jgi:probable HAF family extracellular repeat protein
VNWRRRILALAVSPLLATAAAPADAVQHYIATPLGSLGGGASSARAINQSGQVTGWASIPGVQEFLNGPEHAFLYSGGVMADLGSIGDLSFGTGVSNDGQVTGVTRNYPALSGGHAFLYSGGTMRDLGTFGGTTSYGTGVNNAGQVTGYSYAAGDVAFRAFLYERGAMRDLGTLGGTTSYGLAINGSGQIAGAASIAGDTAVHAFLYTGGNMTDIGTLGGTGSDASALSANGQVTGSSQTAGNAASHAFLYSGGAMRDIGALVPYHDSQGVAVNNSGQVIVLGYRGGDEGQSYYLYSDGTMYLLDSLIVSGALAGYDLEANGINDSGQIAATYCQVGACRAYRLDPIPAQTPASVPTLSYGALGVMAMLLAAVGMVGRRAIRRHAASRGGRATV